MKTTSNRDRLERPQRALALIAGLLLFALPICASAQQYYPPQTGGPLGPGSIGQAPQQLGPTSPIPGNFTYGAPQGFVGEHPAYGQSGIPGGSSACVVDRNGNTRLVDQGGVASPYSGPAPGGHY